MKEKKEEEEEEDSWGLTPYGLLVAQAIRAAKEGMATEQQKKLLRKHGFSSEPRRNS